eukprot:1853142-Alexandrium_andersonii.AAC.1
MAEALWSDAGPPPQCPAKLSRGRLPSGAVLHARVLRARELGVPLRGASSCCVKASSPMARCPSGGVPEMAMRGLCERGSASLRGV